MYYYSALVVILFHLSFLLDVTIAAISIFQPLGTQNPTFSLSNRIKTTILQETGLPPENMDLDGIPIPTNDWWCPIMGNPGDGIQNKSYPIFSNPYKLEFQTETKPYGIHISYPVSYRVFGPINDNGAASYYTHGAGIYDMVFTSSVFENTVPRIHVISWDDMGARVALSLLSSSTSLSSNKTSKMIMPLVSGMALLTAEYTLMQAKVTSQHSIIKINGNTPPTSSFTTEEDSKLVLELNNGQIWILYSTGNITWGFQNNSLMTTEEYTGILRLALLPNGNKNYNLYDPFASCIVRGGLVEAYNSKGYMFFWKTKGNCSTNGLLHLALPHHEDILDLNSVEAVENITLSSPTRGLMQGYRTLTNNTTWILYENDTAVDEIGFYPLRSPTKEDIEKYKIIEILKEELNDPYSFNPSGSYYFTGKIAQKAASLCLLTADPTIREMSGENLTANGTMKTNNPLLYKCLTKLTKEWNRVLDNNFTYPLNYDALYRGILSSEGFAKNDSNADFGNTAYNDHHYHYGYWVVSGVILRYLYPSWERAQELEDFLTILIRDVSNPSYHDIYFPRFRAYDWYNGLSYSHGLIPFEDGKDEESTSEEMNYHYGIMLFGRILKNRNIEDMGKLLLKSNKRAIQKYIFMKRDSNVHPSIMLKNKITGIFFDNKVDYATWFGANREYIHGIQMLPITPVNDYFRTSDFVKEEWDDVLSKIPLVKGETPPSSWESLLYTNIAGIYPDIALAKLQTVPLDDGLYRSWALYSAITKDQLKTRRLLKEATRKYN